MVEAKKYKILIAEDERSISRAMELKLQHLGYDVVVAGDGEETLELLKNDKFDLVLLDLVMPKKDGFAVLKEMQFMGNKTPVIVSSNLSQSEDVVKAKAMGARDYLIKSNISIVDVVERVKKILG
jgi:DNA-binding response OmpR family regulator